MPANSFAGMTKPIVYIETTIPNFYYDLRSSAAVTSRRIWTRKWWESAAESDHRLTSQIVVEELSAGTSKFVPLRLALLKDLPELGVTAPVEAVARTYIENKLMPAHPGGDAFHLALASFFECDFIVTWNCRHLANPNKFGHIRALNGRLGLPTPQIVTPQQLLGRFR
jgi:hypothetical protein